MSDYSNEYHNSKEARDAGFILVQPWAYIMLECPHCYGLLRLESWEKHGSACTAMGNPVPEILASLKL